jgi:hypothetical protein
LHQFQVRYRLLDAVLRAGMHVTALMQGTIDGGQAEARLGSDLFQGEFSHARLATSEDNDSFIILLAVLSGVRIRNAEGFKTWVLNLP